MTASNFSIQALLDLDPSSEVKVRRSSLDSTASSSSEVGTTDAFISSSAQLGQFSPFPALSPLLIFGEQKSTKSWRKSAESPELPSSTTVDVLSPDRRIELSSSDRRSELSSPDRRAEFPGWTQKQLRGGGGGRRPYSRSCVISLSWWYRHLPYLSTAEMETLSHITQLSRHQIKIWWQNRRHSQRTRAADTAAQLTAGLPDVELGGAAVVPGPQSTERVQVFKYLLQFYFSQVVPRISYSQSYSLLHFLPHP